MKSQLTSFNPLLAALIALLVAGCNTTYKMKVDAISNPEANASGESYVLVPRNPDTDVNDLRYQETVGYIKTALSGKGMYEALDPKDADMVIEVEYGMEPPRREFKEVEEPVFATIQEPDQIRLVSSRDPKTGQVITYQVRVPGARHRELIGYETRLISVIVNEKYLNLAAKENDLALAGDSAASEIWAVRVRNYDESDDLREYLPIMAASATDYLGEDTGTQQDVKIKANDEVVDFIKKGIKRGPQPIAASTAPKVEI